MLFYIPFMLVALVGMRRAPPRILSRLIPAQDWARLRVSKMLLPLTLVIMVLALPKIVRELFPISKDLIIYVHWTSEIVEAFISFWIITYAVEKFRELAVNGHPDASKIASDRTT